MIFQEPEIAICGNGVVEDGEECDCGWEEDCLEECCWPQRTKYTSNQLPCTLRPAKQCSPSQGPCCDRDCTFNVGNMCREDNGCRDQSYCNGHGTHCPASFLKPNKTVCNEEFVCFQGVMYTIALICFMGFILRNVQDLYVWPMGWSHVNVCKGQTIPQQKPVNSAAKNQEKISLACHLLI